MSAVAHAPITFPRIAGLSAITPFVRRWESAQRQRTEMQTAVDALSRCDRTNTILRPFAKLSPRVEHSWLLLQTVTLFEGEHQDFTSMADVKAVHAASLDRLKEIAEVSGLASIASVQHFDRHLTELETLVNDPKPSASEVARVEGRLTFRTLSAGSSKDDSDDHAQEEESLSVSPYELSLIDTHHPSLTRLHHDFVPRHPGRAYAGERCSFVAYLGDLHNWIVAVEKTKGLHQIGPHREAIAIGSGPQDVGAENGPFVSGCFRWNGTTVTEIPVKQWKLMRRLWGQQVVLYEDAAAAVGYDLSDTHVRRNFRALMSAVNDSFTEHRIPFEAEFTSQGSVAVRLKHLGKTG